MVMGSTHPAQHRTRLADQHPDWSGQAVGDEFRIPKPRTREARHRRNWEDVMFDEVVNFGLGEQFEALRDMVRRFAAEEIAPRARQIDADNEIFEQTA